MVSSDAVLGAVALLATAFVALAGSMWTLRQTKRLRDENVSVGQRALDQKAFSELRAELKQQIDDLRLEIVGLRRELAAMRGKLAATWRYVQVLRSVMRLHKCDPASPLVIPPTPDELVDLPFDTLDL